MMISRKRMRSSRKKVEHPELEEKFKAKKVLKLMTCVSLPSKSSMGVLAGTQELLVNLRRHGYPVLRIHTDSEPTFTNRQFKAWCKNRAMVRTQSCPDEHQQNGRAEAAIASINSRVRKLLHASKMETTWWSSNGGGSRRLIRRFHSLAKQW